MLTKNDLEQIKGVVQDVILPIDLRLERVERKVDSIDLRLGEVENKVDKMGEDIKDLQLETKAIHEIIKTQGEDHEKRITHLEAHQN